LIVNAGLKQDEDAVSGPPDGTPFGAPRVAVWHPEGSAVEGTSWQES